MFFSCKANYVHNAPYDRLVSHSYLYRRCYTIKKFVTNAVAIAKMHVITLTHVLHAWEYHE